MPAAEYGLDLAFVKPARTRPASIRNWVGNLSTAFLATSPLPPPFVALVKRAWNAWKSGQETQQLDTITIEVLPGARNLKWNDVQIHVVAGDSTNVTNVHQQCCADVEKYEALRRLPDPNGFSWDRYKTCIPETRTLQLKEMYTWIHGRREGRTGAEIFLVAAPAGSGKTALAHTISQQVHKDGHLLASFFFDQMKEQSTVSNLLASIIRGLCDVNGRVRHRVCQLLVKDTSLASAVPVRQFDELILPVCSLLPSDRYYVLIIDGLDEDHSAVLLPLLQDEIPRLPPTFRIIVTTRPEQQIMVSLANMRHIQCSEQSLTGEPTQEDLARYIQAHLRKSERYNEISSKLIADFVVKSDGLFLWAATVLNHLEFSFCPVSELRSIVYNRQPENCDGDDIATRRLDALYQRILSKLYWNDAMFVVKYRSVVGALVSLREPLSPTGLAKLYQGEVTEDDVIKVCMLLRPLLRDFSPKNPRQPIRLLHLSVQQYLTRRAPPPYRLYRNEHNRNLLRCTLLAIESELESTDAVGYTAGSWDLFHIPKIPVVTKGSILEHL
ncbi:hypothetical protein FA15DRAFT_707519 [Coprinopsis marcescibilis]|uniref:Nephrocystin 3-like N-terminal domain-containing protein n=1 Tax=Coprinopsis marcescibilis TaxID=230819 RepID=A0A5C3KLG7_COPMA|nr:hypothetical protein FA15DRAFT_707519 [Coprinopsis marcescibilis]